MDVGRQERRYADIETTQDQRVCDSCGDRFMTGVVAIQRAHSAAVYCHRCASLTLKTHRR